MVLEVGIGGRLDCTNVFKETTATVITQLDLDHVQLLGDTGTVPFFSERIVLYDMKISFTYIYICYTIQFYVQWKKSLVKRQGS